MTNDDQDSADQHSVLTDDGSEFKNGRKGRLKDALFRTKNKFNNFREEREAKKQAKAGTRPSEDVDDFLAAGRASFASSTRPSLASEAQDSVGESTVSPRPSTSDSHSQPSPRRGPPISVPRIDVSTSTRFPNAKTVSPAAFHPQTDRFGAYGGIGNGQDDLLLRPEYKIRSQSSSSIASGSRKARIRGLSVGFADTPPVVIGEGGDAAQAPPVEISRAKARARSASPQGRKPYPDTATQPDARRQMLPRGMSDNSTGAFVPRGLDRTPTGLKLDSIGPKSPRGPHDDELIPRGIVRTQTGFSPTGSPRIRHQPPPAPVQPQHTVLPLSLGQIELGKSHLTEEFERTMGFRPASANSQVNGSVPGSQPPQIVAPKPQRAPPSYDLIEKGRSGEFDSKVEESVRNTDAPMLMQSNSQPQQKQQSPNSPRNYDLEHFRRRPVPAPQPISSETRIPAAVEPLPESEQVHISPDSKSVPQTSQVQAPAQSSREYYPPPPQRQPTYVIRNIQRLPNLHTDKDQQNSDVTAPREKASSDDTFPHVAAQKDDGYRSFADRQKTVDSTQRFRRTSPDGSTQRITSQYYEESPSDYAGSIQPTPHTATEPSQNNLRFYERIRQETGPSNVL